MSHSKLVISVSDNPPDRAPRYPGKFNRNNIGGTTMTRDEWLQNHTDIWVMYMKDKPAYKQSYLSVRARVLHSHLSLTLSNLYRGKVEDKKCRKLLQHVEQWLLGVKQDIAEQEQMEEEHAHRDEKGEETRGMVIGERGEDEREKYEREKYERGENKGGKDHIGDEDDEEMDWGSEETCEEWEPESQRKNRTKNEYEVKKNAE